MVVLPLTADRALMKAPANEEGGEVEQEDALNGAEPLLLCPTDDEGKEDEGETFTKNEAKSFTLRFKYNFEM